MRRLRSTSKPEFKVRPIPAAIGMLTATALLLCSPVIAQDDFSDPGAEAFLKNCMRCHKGILTGNDLQNTTLSTPENMEATVRRMEQQYTAPLTDQERKDIVELLLDKEVKFRLEEAQLMQEPSPMAAALSDGGEIDTYALQFVKNCAVCHTVGGGGMASGGDLTATKDWAVPRLQAAVSAMQARVGPLTTEQINGLTELLKDENRMTRLQAAGYKVVAPMPTPSPTPNMSTDDSAQAFGRYRAEQVKAAIAREGGHHGGHQSPPYLLLFASVAVAAVLGFGCYMFSKDR